MKHSLSWHEQCGVYIISWGGGGGGGGGGERGALKGWGDYQSSLDVFNRGFRAANDPSSFSHKNVRWKNPKSVHTVSHDTAAHTNRVKVWRIPKRNLHGPRLRTFTDNDTCNQGSTSQTSERRIQTKINVPSTGSYHCRHREKRALESKISP